MNFLKLRTDKQGIISAALVGTFLAAGPFLFWRIFLQQLPLTGSGNATLSERFEESEVLFTATPIPQEEARLRELLAYPVNSLAVDRSSGIIRVYEEGTGRAFEIHPTSLQVSTLSDIRLEDYSHTLWSPNGSEVITLFIGKEASQYRYFDYRSSRVAALPPNVRTVTFSPNGDRILTARDTQDGSRLFISKPDGTDEWIFNATRLNVIRSYWPKDDTIVLMTKREDKSEDLLAIDMDTHLNLLLENYSDLDILWAPNGSRALVSYEDSERGPVLSLLDLESKNLRPLPITTRASKCAWHKGSSRVTCGVPAQTTSASRDTVTSVDLQTGELSVRYTAPEDVWIALQNPEVLPRGDALVFVNIFDKRPYMISW